MDGKRSIADYRAQAREQLLGHYGVAVGSFVLLFVIVYGVTAVVLGAYSPVSVGHMIGQVTTQGEGVSVPITGVIGDYIVATLLSFAVGAITALISVGYLYMLREISYGRTPQVKDLFFCIRNHPDKVIIMYAVIEVANIIAMFAADMLGFKNMSGGIGDGKLFFEMTIAYVLGMAVYLCVYLMFAMCYLVYLDDTELTVKECMYTSMSLMKGNKLRFVYMILSFMGYYLLGVISLGIGLLWVMPYQKMTTINFYKDLRHED